jgi:hypothetical protein
MAISEFQFSVLIFSANNLLPQLFSNEKITGNLRIKTSPEFSLLNIC